MIKSGCHSSRYPYVYISKLQLESHFFTLKVLMGITTYGHMRILTPTAKNSWNRLKTTTYTYFSMSKTKQTTSQSGRANNLKRIRKFPWNRAIYIHIVNAIVVIEAEMQILLIESFPRPRWNFQTVDLMAYTKKLDTCTHFIQPKSKHYFVILMLAIANKHLSRSYSREYMPHWNKETHQWLATRPICN